MRIISKKVVQLEGLTLYTNNCTFSLGKKPSTPKSSLTPLLQISRAKTEDVLDSRSGVALAQQTWVALALLAAASPSPPPAARS